MIGKKLRELLKLRGVKQSKLAEYLSISPSRLNNYLSDKREPDLDMLTRIASFLEVDLNYFTDIKFVVVAADIPEPVASAPDPEFVYIERLMVNSKRRSRGSIKFALPKSFLKGLNAEKLLLYEAHTDIADVAKQGDYLIVEPFSPETASNGSLMIYRGRNYRLVRLFIHKGEYVFVHSETNTLESAHDLKSYDIIRMVVSRL